MSATLLAFVALALTIWGLLNRVTYQRHVRKVAEIERRLALRTACLDRNGPHMVPA